MKTGDKRTEEAEVMFYAIGGFQAPLYPTDMRGKEDFKGELFHSARWRHDVIFKKKRVGVIGNGCSACVILSCVACIKKFLMPPLSAQFIPQISEDPSVQLVNFCRTPQWYLPRVSVHMGSG